MPEPSPETTESAESHLSALALSRQAAGAGVVGLIGLVAFLGVAAVFFITENYFVAMLGVSLALLVYATGAEVGKLLLSTVTVFVSSRHLTGKAIQLQETLAALEDHLHLRRDALGELKTKPLEHRMRVRLPDNALVRDLVAVQEAGKGYDYVEYVTHSYYVECQELYDHSATHLDFVSGAMPLFGLMGTVLGLIAMFDSLGSSPTIEAIAPALALALKNTLYGALYSAFYKISATRFEQRLKGLDYDFDTLCRALSVICQNEAVIQVQR
jgi:biopolymer transport protein ExbB/TolQ